jgi:hypothetical protein
MFQMFAALAYSMSSRNKCVFLRDEQTKTRHTYWQTIFRRLSIFVDPDLPNQLHKFAELREPHFHYFQLPLRNDLDIYMSGYFQSYKYLTN